MVIAKIVRGEEIRRINIEENTTFEELTTKTVELFGVVGPVSFQYEDDEKDIITASSTIELQEAIKLFASSGRVLRLQIVDPSSKSSQGLDFEIHIPISFDFPFSTPCRRPLGPFGFRCPNPASESPQAHHAFCDGCKSRIVGSRFKCNTCPNFDFCEGCQKQEHLGHSFTRIDDPKSIVHQAVCDSCNNWIVGIRYKCTECPDYDLCGTCRSKDGIHDSHPFIELTDRHPSRFLRRPTRRGCRSQEASGSINIPIVHEAARESPKNVTPLESKAEVPESISVDAPKLEEPIATPTEEKEEPVPVASSDHPLKTAIQMLENMGFTDRKVTIPLLISKNLDLSETIQHLLNL